MCKSKLKNARNGLRGAVLMAFVLLLSGCAVKLVYNQLDWVIPWYLDDYMSLNSSQEEVFDKRLKNYLTWHRKTQLPEYGAFLREVADDLETGMTKAGIHHVQERTRELGQVLLQRLVPDMVALFRDASDEQVAELFEAFEKQNEKYREEYIEASEKAQRKKRARETEAYIERWTGRLNSEQKALIREGTSNYQLMGQEWLDARLAWQQEFRRILGVREDEQAFEKALTALLLADDFGQSEAFAAKLAHNQLLLENLYFRLDQTLSDRQRERAVEKLRSYARDFHELARE
ncbi:MAG: DUF6279 family lipoprotein [Ketobacteraceae bacterium]|nr:DUF6279 family lipoprotein [Ketobacteraceae bacterium]